MKFFTADLHLGHERVLDPDFSNRPFPTIKEHDDYIIDQINLVVQPKDELFVLGDFCWERPGHYRHWIKCRTIHLLWGNHDKSNYAQHFSSADDVRMVKLGSDSSGELPVSLQAFCSHYAHAYWPSSHHGCFHLYGHNHDMREATLDEVFPGRRSMDCGVDAAKRLLGDFRPFSDQWIVSRMIQKPGHDPIEFYKNLRGEK